MARWTKMPDQTDHVPAGYFRERARSSMAGPPVFGTQYGRL